MRQEHQIRTGDPATDKGVAEEMKQSFEAAGMRVTVSPMAGGGYKIVTELEMPAAVAEAAQAAATVTGHAFCMHAFTVGGDERAALASSLEAGDVGPLVQFLDKTRAAKDWDDRAFMLGLVADAAPVSAIEALVARAPDDPQAHLVAGAYHLGKVWEARGGGTADTIGEEGQRAMDEHLIVARAELERAAALDATDPTGYALLIGVAQLGGEVDGHKAFELAVGRDPTNLAAYQRIVAMTTEKWSGDLGLCLRLARRGTISAPPGSDLPSVLFRAHFEAWFYRKRFQEDSRAADAYTTDPVVRAELEQTFDRWTRADYPARRSGVPGLHWAAAWFFLVGDAARTKRAIKLTQNVQPPQMLPWNWVSELAYTQALQASA
jgi:hypothetical protein